jgi:AAA15 family ATPase/GTPase
LLQNQYYLLTFENNINILYYDFANIVQNGGIIMLLEFKINNYKSFINEAKFSMVAAPKQSGLDYSLLKDKVKRKEIKGLCSSVIYGPNAAGKSNIISAMDVFRSIVLRGNIRNTEEKAPANPASSAL